MDRYKLELDFLKSRVDLSKVEQTEESACLGMSNEK